MWMKDFRKQPGSSTILLCTNYTPWPSGQNGLTLSFSQLLSHFTFINWGIFFVIQFRNNILGLFLVGLKKVRSNLFKTKNVNTNCLLSIVFMKKVCLLLNSWKFRICGFKIGDFIWWASSKLWFVLDNFGNSWKNWVNTVLIFTYFSKFQGRSRRW